MIAKIILSCLMSITVFANDCIVCHPKEQKKCTQSNHFTLAKSINITRKAFGISDSNVTLQSLPLPKHIIEKPQDIVDDMLRRKCLKCHLGVQSDRHNYKKRENICLACHENHNKKGKCQKSKISIDKCISCHNAGYVGMDYLGMYPHDFDKAYRAPISADGNYPKQFGGIDYHHLSADIHYKKGMSCVDCHTSRDGKDWENAAKCTDCHTVSKKNHPEYHHSISCSACHSSWNSSSYMLSMLRDDTANYKQWKRLTTGEDEYLSNFLIKNMKTSNTPIMPDWLTGKIYDGVWYSGYRYRRWEDMLLANGRAGKIEIIRPLYQYRISYRDKNMTMRLDDIDSIKGENIEAWVPYSPHTISKRAKPCERCHDNALLDIHNPMRAEIIKTKLPQKIFGASPLTDSQLNRMKSYRYKKERLKSFFH